MQSNPRRLRIGSDGELRPESNLALRIRPQPLIDVEKQLVVIWSPRCACTTVYVWFSHLCGKLEEVRAYSAWPHDHRIKVYLRSEYYIHGLGADPDRFRTVRIIRDPYTRAASIFRHALQSQFANAEILEFSSGEFSVENGVSFQQFLDFLANARLDLGDPHYRPQFHPFERNHSPDHVINISKENLFDALNALESRFGWSVTDFTSMEWLHALEKARRAPPSWSGGGDQDDTPFSHRSVRRNGPFPPYGLLLTPKAKSKIDQIYSADFSAYANHL